MTASRQLPFDFNFQNEFVFENFVVTDLNAEILSVLKNNDAKDPEKQSAELERFYYIWGEAGVGKSHLLQALCQTLDNSVYLPFDKFSCYGPDILKGLENMDLICLDDINAILGKQEWEEALFEFYNLLHEKNKRLVICANQAPGGLPVVLPDLASRLSWGVSYQLHELNDVEKAQALQMRARSRSIPLKDEVLSYILQRSPRGMDNLFAVLDQLDQVSLTQKRRVTIPFVRELMRW